jgi:hypothetical protein
MYIGSAAGLFDLGMVRIRKAPTSTVLYIGSVSDIAWADNLYLTVVNEFTLWARPWKTLNENSELMDSDLMYADQNSAFDPCVIMGPDAILWRTGSTIAYAPTAVGFVFDSTITSYLWTAVGASATSGMTTTTPTITYNADGQYVVSCKVTAANGKLSTGYRLVVIVSDTNPPAEATINSATGDQSTGGWNFSLTVYDTSDQSIIRDFTKVILFAKDVYNNVQGSVGPIAGYENIVCIGWVDGETIYYNAEQSSVQFTVQGLQFWLNNIESFGTGLVETSGAITDWKFVHSLTLDKALWNLLYWRSTVMTIVDVFLSTDTRTNAGLIAPEGSLWSQLAYYANKILCYPVTNRYGQLFFEVDTQYVPVADRTAFPVVIDIQKGDWRSDDGISIERSAMSKNAMIDAAGTGDTEDKVWYCRAPGTSFTKFGSHETHDQLMLADQTQCNALGGLLLAKANNEFPTVDIPLAMNNRLIDIAPRQYISLTISAGDTPRGLSWSSKKFIPRHVSYTHDQQTGILLTDITCEAETSGSPGVTYIPPAQPINPTPVVPPIDPPIWPIFPGPNPIVPPGPIPPPIPPINDCIANMDAPANGPYDLSMGGSIWNYGPTDPRVSYMPCTMRSDSHVNKTRVALSGSFYSTSDGGNTWSPDTDNTWYQFQALDASFGVLATATWDTVTDSGIGTRMGTISLPAATAVHWWMLTLTIGNPIYYIYPPLLATGPITVTAESGVPLLSDGYALSLNALYAVEGKPGTGPWSNGFTDSWDIQVGQYIPAGSLDVTYASHNGSDVSWVDGTSPSFHIGPNIFQAWSVTFDCPSVLPAGTYVSATNGPPLVHLEYLTIDLLRSGSVVETFYLQHDGTSSVEFDQVRFVNNYFITIDATFMVGSSESFANFGDGVHKDETVIWPNKRLYFYADFTDNVRVADLPASFTNNGGAIDYNLWHAGVAGDKRIDVDSINLFNICGVQ